MSVPERTAAGQPWGLALITLIVVGVLSFVGGDFHGRRHRDPAVLAIPGGCEIHKLPSGAVFWLCGEDQRP